MFDSIIKIQKEGTAAQEFVLPLIPPVLTIASKCVPEEGPLFLALDIMIPYVPELTISRSLRRVSFSTLFVRMEEIQDLLTPGQLFLRELDKAYE